MGWEPRRRGKRASSGGRRASHATGGRRRAMGASGGEAKAEADGLGGWCDEEIILRKSFVGAASRTAAAEQPSPADTQSNRWPWRRANHTGPPPHHRSSLALWRCAGAGLRLPHCGARRPAARRVTCSLSPSPYLNRRRRRHRLSASAARAHGSSANCFPRAPSLGSYCFLFLSSGSDAAAHLQALVPKLHY